MKINNAGDDAAGLSLSTKLNSTVRSLSIARNNAQTGINYLQTGSGSLSNMLTVAQRIRDLAVQSANGVYSSGERDSLQQEVSALSQEISQIKDSTTFSDRQIFSGFPSKFMKEINQLSKVEAEALGYVTISSTEEFVNLISDTGSNTSDKTFVLMKDIDMSGVSNYASKQNFAGTFDGNGYAVKNLHLDESTGSSIGLFGAIQSSSVIKNVGIENCNVSGQYDVGGIAGGNAGTIKNCYVKGTITGSSDGAGGIVSSNSGNITDCYFEGSVNGFSGVGGVAGYGGEYYKLLFERFGFRRYSGGRNYRSKCCFNFQQLFKQ